MDRDRQGKGEGKGGTVEKMMRERNTVYKPYTANVVSRRSRVRINNPMSTASVIPTIYKCDAINIANPSYRANGKMFCPSGCYAVKYL